MDEDEPSEMATTATNDEGESSDGSTDDDVMADAYLQNSLSLEDKMLIACWRGDLRKVKKYVEKRGVDPSALLLDDNFRGTPLHVATRIVSQASRIFPRAHAR